MFDEGFKNLTSIDISFTVIKQMQEIYKDKMPTMIFKQMDARSLQFDDG